MKEADELNAKLAELTDEELKTVTGGIEISELPFLPKRPDLYEEYGSEWTIQEGKGMNEIHVQNMGSYEVYYPVTSHEDKGGLE